MDFRAHGRSIICARASACVCVSRTWRKDLPTHAHIIRACNVPKPRRCIHVVHETVVMSTACLRYIFLKEGLEGRSPKKNVFPSPRILYVLSLDVRTFGTRFYSKRYTLVIISWPFPLHVTNAFSCRPFENRPNFIKLVYRTRIHFILRFKRYGGFS